MVAILKIYFSLFLLNPNASWLEKYLKSFGSEVQDGRYLENLFYTSSPEPNGQLTPNLVGSIRWLVDQKWLQSYWSEIQDGCHWGHLEDLIFASSPKPKSQIDLKLGRKHLGDLYLCRSKMAKIVLIGNPRWLPTWKSIFHFFSWTERLTDFKLGRKHQGDL